MLLGLIGMHVCRLQRPLGRVCGQVSSETVRVWVVAVQDGHQVTDVGRGQPERFDFRQFCVRRHIGYAIPEVGERVVDALRPPPFLFVGRVPALDDAHHRHRRHQSRRRLRRTALLLLQLLLQLLLSLLQLQQPQSFIVFVVVIWVLVGGSGGIVVIALLFRTVL